MKESREAPFEVFVDSEVDCAEDCLSPGINPKSGIENPKVVVMYQHFGTVNTS